jgi:hypothetical protein
LLLVAGDSNGGGSQAAASTQPAGKSGNRDVSQHKTTIQNLDQELFVIIVAKQQKRIKTNAKATDEQEAEFKKTFDLIRMSKLKAAFLGKLIWMDDLGADHTRQLISATTDLAAWIAESRACLEFLDAPNVKELTPRIARIETQNKSILESLLRLE